MIRPVYHSFFYFSPCSFTRECLLDSRFPFLFLGREKGEKLSLLLSGLGYLAMHVTAVISAIPYSLLPLFQLLPALAGVIFPCMMQQILTKGTLGQAISPFCMPQKWDTKVTDFLWVTNQMTAVPRFLNSYSFTLIISLSFLLWNHLWYYMINVC